MEKKKWIQYSWQTLLLCIVVSLSHPVSAKTSPPLALNKEQARKPKTTKSKPASSNATEKSTSLHSKRTHPQQAQREPHQKKTPSTQESSARAISTKTSKGKAVTPPQPIAQRASRPLGKNSGKDIAEAKNANPILDRAKFRYVTVLKETRHKTMEKTVVALPIVRTVSQKQRGTAALPIASQKYPDRAGHKKQRAVVFSRTSHPLLSQSVSMAIASAPILPLPPQKDTLTPEPAPVTPTAPQAASIPAMSITPTPQEKPEPATVLASIPAGTPVREPSPAVIATPPSPLSSQTSVITFVEQSRTASVAGEEKRTKEPSRYTPQKAPFTVTVNEESQNYRTNSVFVLPGDEVYVAVVDSQKRAEYTVLSTLGSERLLAPRRWRWTTPTTIGVYPVKIINRRTNVSVTLNVFVMVPLDRIEDGYLNGYHIGTYPTEPLRQLAMYTRPRGLIEVTEENEDILVSPHFRLRQFLCKQDGGYPKYLILEARLLATLEQLLEMVNAHGYSARTFTIMSGYRTPYYNRAIGNNTTYSRHLWGDAADIFIDEDPRDGRMDDLNQDGVVDAHDADVIYQLIDNASEPRIQKIMMGGLARYRETSSHGPFIHVDARGSYARWGIKTLTRGGSALDGTAFQERERSLSQPSYLDTQSTTEPVP